MCLLFRRQVLAVTIKIFTMLSGDKKVTLVLTVLFYCELCDHKCPTPRTSYIDAINCNFDSTFDKFKSPAQLQKVSKPY